MKPYIYAETAEQLGKRVKADLDSSRLRKDIINDGEWDERRQLGKFLMAAGDEDLLNYPLEICHTPNTKPDFQLSFPGSVIGVEASRITQETLHRYEVLRRQGKTTPVTAVSPLLVDAGRINNDELIARTTPGATTGDSWNDPKSEQDFYMSCAREMIIRKTVIRRRADYQDYGTNWLLLWDELSKTEEDFHLRGELLYGVLAAYWTKEKVFDMIILECEELKRFTVLGLQGIKRLPV